MTNVSDAEMLLIDYFDHSCLLGTSLNIIEIYRIMIEDSFMKNDKSVYSKALRLAYNHIRQGKYRMTLEFDNIIINTIRAEKLKKLKKL